MITYIYLLRSAIADIQLEYSFENDDKMKEHLSHMIRDSITMSVKDIVYKKTGKTVPDYNERLKQYYGN